ncbi:MAG: SDR family oxidoreductase [Gemmatimonadota bacterium]
MRVLVTGATGYIGGRLVPRLLNAGHDVRVMARDLDRLSSRPWTDWVEKVEANVFDPESLGRALEGVDAAYYLIHSMCSGDDFAERDRTAARSFADAAGHLKQVVYLGGILPGADAVENSEHLSSRAEVGEILRERLPTTEFRAGPIIGSGSASFEMVRYLTERLPAMVAPRWIENEVQPIGVRNILEYLVAVLGREDALGVIDVGSEILTFRSMMLEYARIRGLPRVIVPLPILAPGLAARWVGLVTPILNCLAVPLVEGMSKPVVGDLTRARELFPDIHPMPYADAVELALLRVQQERVNTRWSDALGDEKTVSFEDREGLFREVRTRLLDVPREAVFRAFTSLGGDRGWLVWKWAWRLRGFMDQLVGGPGLRRGRRDPARLRAGDAVDFWRVEEIEEPSLLRLRAEMKVPGRAWLQFEAEPEGTGTRLVQAALFQPRGFLGWAYWYSVYPAHAFIFDQLIDSIAELAREMASEDEARRDRLSPPPAA